MTLGGAPSCGITYDCHSDDSRDVIYIYNTFIIQATRVFLPRLPSVMQL